MENKEFYTKDEFNEAVKKAVAEALGKKKEPYKPKSKYSKEWISKSEIEKIISSPLVPKEKIAVLIIYGCALRVSELCKIRIKDIDFENGTVTIWESKKTSDPANVPILENAIEILREYVKNKKPDDFLIEGYYPDKPMDSSSIYYMVNRIAKSCGISRKIGTHTFRRSRATHLLDDGLPLERVSQLLRHKNLATTIIYLKMAVKSLKRDINKFDSTNKVKLFINQK